MHVRMSKRQVSSIRSFNIVNFLDAEGSESPPTPSAVESARSAGPSPIPEGCSLLALDLDIETQGTALEATGVSIGSD